jgi:hypothetical protein
MEHPATAPPAKQEGKRPRDADLLGYPTPTGCSTTRRRLRKHWFLVSFALHRWLDSPRIVKTADDRSRWRAPALY